jgi:hypothetical protein
MTDSFPINAGERALKIRYPQRENKWLELSWPYSEIPFFKERVKIINSLPF